MSDGRRDILCRVDDADMQCDERNVHDNHPQWQCAARKHNLLYRIQPVRRDKPYDQLYRHRQCGRDIRVRHMLCDDKHCQF